MGFFHNQIYALTTTDSPRPIDNSVSDSRVVFTPGPTHVHSPRSRIHTGPWVFFTTKPLVYREKIPRDLLTMVYLTGE